MVFMLLVGECYVVTMTGGVHDISVLLTDDYGNQQTFSFEYEQPIYLGFDFIDGESFYFH